jgi:hypothetical protein
MIFQSARCSLSQEVLSFVCDDTTSAFEILLFGVATLRMVPGSPLKNDTFRKNPTVMTHSRMNRIRYRCCDIVKRDISYFMMTEVEAMAWL